MGRKRNTIKGPQCDLSDLHKAVLNGNKSNIKQSLLVLLCKENETCHSKIPNLVLFACKSNLLESLKYLLSDELANIVVKVNGEFFSPEEEDKPGHNIFYYCIRNCNKDLLECVLINWPENYFENHQDISDSLLSSSYQELILKNVPLSNEIKDFVTARLLSLKFPFASSSEEIYNIKNLRGRVAFLIDKINVILEFTDINDISLYVLTFVTKNIHILKRILKQTYDIIPWEEMEFCLICFISTYRKDEEINLFYQHILNLSRIKYHLSNFQIKLKHLFKLIPNLDVETFATLPKIGREKVIDNIIGEQTSFRDLYNDYQFIRDACSLKNIENAINLADVINPLSREGKLVLFRALQIMGQHLKNTIDAPKLSPRIINLLLLSLSPNTRNIIIELRDSISQPSSVYKRLEIEKEKEIFQCIRDDMMKVSRITSDVLLSIKLDILCTILKDIEESSDMEHLKYLSQKIALNSWEKHDDSFLSGKNAEIFQCGSRVKVYNLLTQLEQISADKNDACTKLFVDLYHLILEQKMFTVSPKEGYFMIRRLSILASHKKLNDNYLPLKHQAKSLLENFPSKWDDKIINLTQKLIIALANYILPRSLGNSTNHIETLRLLAELFYYTKLDYKNIHLLRAANVNPCSISSTSYSDENSNFDIISLELKNILSNYGINFDAKDAIKNNLTDKRTLMSIQVLLLDLMSLLENQNSMKNNILSFDDIPFVLSGKNLRDYLAHHNDIINILLDDSQISFACIWNSIQYISRIKVINKNHTLWVNSFKPKSLYDRYVLIINKKNEFFSNAANGFVEELISGISDGADILSRDYNRSTCLHYAAKASDACVLNYLSTVNNITELKIHLKNIHGQTPLHWAAEWDRVHSIQILLQMNLLIDDCDNLKRSPLHLASKNGCINTVSALIENKANIHLKDAEGKAPLHYAVQHNYKNIMSLLLKHETPDETSALGDYTCLHIASEEGHLDLVKDLILKGANINTRSYCGSTPLHSATTKGHLEVTEVLILNGADINATQLNGLTPLHNAAVKGRENVVEILLKKGAVVDSVYSDNKISPLYFASEYGYDGVVKLLLKYGADPNKFTTSGLNPFLIAVGMGHYNVVETLIQHGADVKVKIANSFSVLHLAVFNDNSELVDILIQNKASVNAASIEKQTPLHIVCAIGNADLIGVLLKHGADIDAKDESGCTPLHVAAAFNNDSVIYYLIKNNAGVNVLNNTGLSPLHCAAMFGSKESVKILLQNSADPNLQGLENDDTPLILSCIQGDDQVVELLLRYGAQVNLSSLMTPLLAAVQGGHKRVVEVLIANGGHTNSSHILIDIQLIVSAMRNNREDILMILIANGIDILSEGPTLLTLSVYFGFKDILDVLLKNNVNPNVACNYLSEFSDNEIALYDLFDVWNVKSELLNYFDEHINITPLMLACVKGNIEIIKLLLSNGADPNYSVVESRSPLLLASRFGFHEIAELLLLKGANIYSRDEENRTSFEQAVAHGHFSVFKVFLHQENFPVNYKGNGGWTLLHIAAQGGNLEITKLLVERGVDINSTNDSGSKAIHIAAREGHEELVEYFLDLGISVEEVGAAKQTLLHYAAAAGRINVVKFLIKKKAAVNSVDINQHSPLHVAMRSGHQQTVNLLLDSGCFFDTINSTSLKSCELTQSEPMYNLFKFTEILFCAVKQNDVGKVESSIGAGAFINALDKNEGGVLHYAAWKGFHRIVNILVKNGADVNIKGKNGLSPLHYAAKFSKYKIVLTLLKCGAVYNALTNTNKTPLDLGTDETVVNLLNFITSCFDQVKKKKISVIDELKKIKDNDVLSAVLRTQDKVNKSIMVIAEKFQFPKVKELRLIFYRGLQVERQIAMSLCLEQRFDEALSTFNVVLQKMKELLDGNDPSILELECDLANTLYHNQQYNEALEIYENTYNKQLVLLGSDHRSTLHCRSCTALVLHRMGRDNESLQLFEKVLKKQKEVLGRNDSDVIKTMYKMAMVLLQVGKCDESLTMSYEAFNNCKLYLGFNDPKTMVAYHNIALALCDMKRYDEAVDIFQKVYEVRCKILGESHSDTLRTLCNMAIAFRCNRREADALKLFNSVLEKQKQILGPRNLDVVITQYNIAQLLVQQGNLLEALKLFKSCHAIGLEILDPSHHYMVDVNSCIDRTTLIIDMYFGSNTEKIQKSVQREFLTAVIAGNVKTVTDFITRGALVNERDTEGRTSLHYAVSSGNFRMVSVLLDKHGDPTIASKKGNTPLHIAVSKNHIDIIKLLVSHTTVSRLYSFINFKTKAESTSALHVASKNGNLEAVIFLLHNGAIYNAPNRNNQTPLDLSQNKQISSLLKLIQKIFEETERHGKASSVDELDPISRACVLSARNSQGKSLQQLSIENVLSSL